MNGQDRAEAMAARLRTTFLLAGLTEDDATRVESAYRAAMALRSGELPEAHPAYLHPARTALILFHDAGVGAVALLSAGTLVDTKNSELAVPLAEIERLCGARVAHLVAEVPSPDSAGDELLERLLVAPYDVQLVALAERLDCARHVHLLPAEDWRAEHDRVRDIYLPVAERTHPLLARRFAWWLGAFHDRFLDQ